MRFSVHRGGESYTGHSACREAGETAHPQIPRSPGVLGLPGRARGVQCYEACPGEHTCFWLAGSPQAEQGGTGSGALHVPWDQPAKTRVSVLPRLLLPTARQPRKREPSR